MPLPLCQDLQLYTTDHLLLRCPRLPAALYSIRRRCHMLALVCIELPTLSTLDIWTAFIVSYRSRSRSDTREHGSTWSHQFRHRWRPSGHGAKLVYGANPGPRLVLMLGLLDIGIDAVLRSTLHDRRFGQVTACVSSKDPRGQHHLHAFEVNRRRHLWNCI